MQRAGQTLPPALRAFAPEPDHLPCRRLCFHVTARKRVDRLACAYFDFVAGPRDLVDDHFSSLGEQRRRTDGPQDQSMTSAIASAASNARSPSDDASSQSWTGSATGRGKSWSASFNVQGSGAIATRSRPRPVRPPPLTCGSNTSLSSATPSSDVHTSASPGSTTRRMRAAPATPPSTQLPAPSSRASTSARSVLSTSRPPMSHRCCTTRRRCHSGSHALSNARGRSNAIRRRLPSTPTSWMNAASSSERTIRETAL